MAAAVVGFLRTSIGGGIGLVLTPTLSLVLPPQGVLALTAPLLNLSDPVTLRYYWRQWDRRQLGLVLPATLAGVVLGTWGLSLLSEVALRRVIGGVALVTGPPRAGEQNGRTHAPSPASPCAPGGREPAGFLRRDVEGLSDEATAALEVTGGETRAHVHGARLVARAELARLFASS